MRASFRLLCLLLALCLLVLSTACKKKEEEQGQEQEETLAENQIAVTWHMGLVCSDMIPSQAGVIEEGTEGYSYSDVITVKKKNTCLTFSVDDGQAADARVYVLSHWRQNEQGAWVLADPGDHYAGGSSVRTATYVRSSADGVTTYTYVTEKNDEHVRLCYNSGQTADGAVAFAKVFLTATNETPTLLRQKDSAVYKDLRLAQYAETDKNFPELAGKTVYIMGDSYFNDYLYAFGKDTGRPSPYNLPNLVAVKYGMTLKNFAKSGSSVSAYATTNNPMCRRISEMDVGSPDIVILEGGRNDLNIDAPLGSLWTDASRTTLSLEETTFCGAVNSCIKQLKEKYPNAMIIGMTCWKVTRQSQSGVTQAQYADAMVRACEANGIPCINAAGFASVDMDSATYRAAYCRTADDISHMNIDGMVRTAPAFEKALGLAWRAFTAET